MSCNLVIILETPLMCAFKDAFPPCQAFISLISDNHGTTDNDFCRVFNQVFPILMNVLGFVDHKGIYRQRQLFLNSCCLCKFLCICYWNNRPISFTQRQGT